MSRTLESKGEELTEAVSTVKLFAQKNEDLMLENKKLRFNLEQMEIGHANPNQKIQLTMKIRDENNRLRDESGKLQRDLQRKLEIIKRLSQ